MSIDQYVITSARGPIQVADGPAGLNLTSASNTNNFFRFNYDNALLETSDNAANVEINWIFFEGMFEVEQPIPFNTMDCIQVTNEDTLHAALVQIVSGGIVTSKALQQGGGFTFINPFTTPPSFTDTVCCVHQDTLVQRLIPSSSDAMSYVSVPIREIKAGDRVISSAGKTIEVKYNIKYLPSSNFIKINKGALGVGKANEIQGVACDGVGKANEIPDQDLLIRPGHPILLDNEEIDCVNLLNTNDIRAVALSKRADVWSLCTEHRDFVLMNGVPVATWSKTAWENFIKNDKTGKEILWWRY